MNPALTGNQPNIQWSGNVALTNYQNSIVTFVFDDSFRFIKYHAFDRYAVSDPITASTNTAANVFFVYHKNNVNFNNHATFRAHQLRLNHVNVCDCQVELIEEELVVMCESVVAPEGNSAAGDWVIANSRYPITLGWTENANEASKIAIPRP
jgi:hypothetical protein